MAQALALACRCLIAQPRTNGMAHSPPPCQPHGPNCWPVPAVPHETVRRPHVAWTTATNSSIVRRPSSPLSLSLVPSSLLVSSASAIPRTIHQLWMSPEGDEDLEPSDLQVRAAITAWRTVTRTMVAASTGPWEHTVWNRTSVRRFLSWDPALRNCFEGLSQWPERQKDFFMYVVLGRLGGIFVDADVVPLKPPEVWFEEASIAALKAGVASSTRLIVGLEARGSPDEARSWRWSGQTQLTIWAAASAPGHPVLLRAAEEYLKSTANDEGTSSHAQYEHSIALGPGLFTTVVRQWLREVQGTNLEDLPSVGGTSRATVVQDTVVLGIDGFGCGQPHSGSRVCNGNTTRGALVQHLFSGAWKSTEEAERWMWIRDDDSTVGGRRRRRSPIYQDWRLPGLALMAHLRASGINLPWEALPLLFSRIIPIGPPLLPAPPDPGSD